MSQVLNSQAVLAYRELQTTRAGALLKNLLDHPESFELHILRYDHIYYAYIVSYSPTAKLGLESSD